MGAFAWIHVPAAPGAKDIVTTALEAGFDTLLFDPGEASRYQGLGKFRALTLTDVALLDEAGEALGPRIVLKSAADQERAMAEAGKAGIVVITGADWRIIPAENLIARFQGKGTRLIAEVETATEARAFLETLEVGTDGVILRPRSPGEIRDLARLLAARNRLTLDLKPARVVEVKQVGSGDRVCVDTCSLLRVGEGMLVGSSAQGLFLVMSEASESEYVASRPFRVNAGPVHAYCLLPDGRTKYLSELEAGDEVLAVDSRGHTRPVVVGRVKIETRPLLRVTADCGGKRVVTLVQNAETIRLVGPSDDEPRSVSVTTLKPGDSVLVRIESGGRHFGMAIQETIVEK